MTRADDAPAAAEAQAPADGIPPGVADYVSRLVEQKLSGGWGTLAAERRRLAGVARRAELELFLAGRRNRKWRGHFSDTRDFVRTYYTVLVAMLHAGRAAGRLSPYYMAKYLGQDGVRRHPLASTPETTLRYWMSLVETDWEDYDDVAAGALWARVRDMAVAYVEAFPEG